MTSRHRAAARAADSPATKKHSRRNVLLGGGAVLGLAVTGTSAWALNRFVIDHVEITDVAAYEAENSSVKMAATADPTAITLTDTTYNSAPSTLTT